MPSSTSQQLMVPAAADPSTLPLGTSPTLQLVPADQSEVLATALLNMTSWKGPLSDEAYLRREKHINSVALTREGGNTTWVLVDTADKNTPRTILAACESILKAAIVAQGDRVEDVTSHATGAVFCRDEYRGRGYAARMMQELGKVLEDWQQREGMKSKFNVLYSDIGKKFYAKSGWHSYRSSHISLLPIKDSGSVEGLPDVVPVHDEDLEDLCKKDQALIRDTASRLARGSSKTVVAYLPSVQTMRWHHAREEFIAQELLGREPRIKGAHVRMKDGKGVWCIWTHMFGATEKENTLYLLRLAIEGEDDFSASCGDEAAKGGHAHNKDQVLAVVACLRAAQQEAAKWNMKAVRAWNPSGITVAAAQRLEPSAEIIDREEESIASLLWYGPGHSKGSIEWIGNEKFGWC